MENIKQTLNTLENINDKYELSNDAMKAAWDKAENSKVYLPLIGKFSSGKSALLNCVLGMSSDFLMEDIKLQTAVPTELTWALDDRFTVTYNDGLQREISWEDWMNEEEWNAETVQYRRAELKNEELQEFQDLVLVDMPGFESGIEVHNRAIDGYISRSLAYIIAFPADDMIMRTSMKHFLQELCQNDMPICVVITKCDKCNSEFEETFDALKDSVQEIMGDREITFCRTSSRNGDIGINELLDFLKRIQEESEQLRERSLRSDMQIIANTTASYLKRMIEDDRLSESELKEKEDQQKREMQQLNEKFSSERKKFYRIITDCMTQVSGDVLGALQAEEDKYIEMVLNKMNIQDSVNLTVRSALTRSLQTRFVDKLEDYMTNISNCVSGQSIGDMDIQISVDVDKIMKNAVSSAVGAAVGFLVLGPIGTAMGLIVELANRIGAKKKREEARRQIHMELESQVYPKIQIAVGQTVETELNKQIESIDKKIQTQIDEQLAAKEKALEDLRAQQQKEEEDKNDRIAQLEVDLETVQQIAESFS